MHLVFLGTGAGNGVPVFYCNCPVCAEAHGSSRLRRTRSAVAVVGEKVYLIDAPPEISGQLLREKIDRVDGLLLTHAHHDHCAGLGDLEVYARFHLMGRLPAVMSRETLDQLELAHGSLAEWLDVSVIEPDQTVSLTGIGFTGLSVSHSPGTLGYKIERNDFTMAYIPDTGPLPEVTKNVLKGVDVLILDATFHGENWYPGQHLTIQQAIETAQELKVNKLFLTHLSMHYSLPITNDELQHEIAKYNGLVEPAYDGLRINFAGT